MGMRGEGEHSMALGTWVKENGEKAGVGVACAKGRRERGGVRYGAIQMREGPGGQ
jgi:hypothetical protein